MPSAESAMIRFTEKPVYLACGQTDMRKSINGLAAIVEGSFKLDPFGEALYVFLSAPVIKCQKVPIRKCH